MASPPFSLDTTVPADTDITSIFPSLNRSDKDVIQSWLKISLNVYGHNNEVWLDGVGTAHGPSVPPAPTTGTSAIYRDANGYPTIIDGETSTVQFLGVPPGTILDFAGASIPNGYLLCDGRAVSQATYPELYAVLGATWGSNAGGNFTLPSLAGRATYSAGGSAGSLGSYFGSATSSITAQSQLPSCNFTISGIAISGISLPGYGVNDGSTASGQNTLIMAANGTNRSFTTSAPTITNQGTAASGGKWISLYNYKSWRNRSKNHQILMPKSTAIVKPSLGLYLDRPGIAVPPNALQGGYNFRVKLGQLNNLNLGWTALGPVLNGPCLLCTAFNQSSGLSELVLASLTDIYKYVGTTLTFLTPIYATGTVSASGTAVTGSGTAWTTTPSGSQWANAKIGDQIAFGSATQNSPTATWYTITHVNSATSITLATSAGTIAGGTAYTIRRLFTGNAVNFWQYDTFALDGDTGLDQFFMTNGKDNVVSWDGVANQVKLNIAYGFTCKALCQFNNMMIYLNCTIAGVSSPTTMLNSDLGYPFHVGNASSGVSGSFRVQGGTDAIVNAFRLQSYMAIYCGRTIVMTYATGDIFVFAFRVAAANKGPVSLRGFAIYPAIHQFIAPDCMYEFDGTTAQIINTHVWRAIIASLDHVRSGNIYSILDEQNGEQVWSVPQTTDPNTGTVTSAPVSAWTEHYLEETSSTTLGQEQLARASAPNSYSTRSFPFTCVGYYTAQATTTWNILTNGWNTYNNVWNSAAFSNAYPQILAGDTNGNVWIVNNSQFANGAALPSYVTFGRRAMSDGRNRALLARVYPFTEQLSTPLDVNVGFADFAEGPVTTAETFTFQQNFPTNIGQYFVPIYRRGRYVDLGFGSKAGNPWILSGYDSDVRPGGFR